MEDRYLTPELFAVETPELVRRYNAVLESLGVPPTALSAFRIDGGGWSPEIAAAKGERDYLCAGQSRPMAILLSPEQERMPLQAPQATYDLTALQAFFDTHRSEIAELTRTDGIGVVLDAGLSRYENPRDLLLIDYIVVHPVGNDRTRDAQYQRQLVAEFLAESDAWADEGLRRRIIEHAQSCGDLRYRTVDLPDLRVPIGSFHTRAFGGVFVLKSTDGDDDFLIFEDKAELERINFRKKNMYHIDDRALLGDLTQAGFVALDIDRYRKNPVLLEEKREFILADAICRMFPEISYEELNHAQKKRKAAELGERLPAVVLDVERLIVHFRNGTQIKARGLSIELQQLLSHPSPRLAEAEQEVVWRLLCRIQPFDVFRLFTTDREYFAEQLATWPVAKQVWVRQAVDRHCIFKARW